MSADVIASFKITTAKTVADKGVSTIYIVAHDGPKSEILHANNPN